MWRKSNEYVELKLALVNETEKAILVTDGDDDFWLPKSQLKNGIEEIGDGLILVEIPQWLAEKKELV